MIQSLRSFSPLAAATTPALSTASIALADEISTAYKGATLHFASAAHRDTFAGDPEHYTPQFGSYYTFGTAEGHKAQTEPHHLLQTWRADVGGYMKKANANWDTVKEQPAP